MTDRIPGARLTAGKGWRPTRPAFEGYLLVIAAIRVYLPRIDFWPDYWAASPRISHGARFRIYQIRLNRGPANRMTCDEPGPTCAMSLKDAK